jgi:hypothetical protein
MLYAGRIFFLCRLLNIQAPHFKSLGEENDEDTCYYSPEESEGEHNDGDNGQRDNRLS